MLKKECFKGDGGEYILISSIKILYIIFLYMEFLSKPSLNIFKPY